MIERSTKQAPTSSIEQTACGVGNGYGVNQAWSASSSTRRSGTNCRGRAPEQSRRWTSERAAPGRGA
eukprot:4588350-Lingulodinium_polyedra.AAC.1